MDCTRVRVRKRALAHDRSRGTAVCSTAPTWSPVGGRTEVKRTKRVPPSSITRTVPVPLAVQPAGRPLASCFEKSPLGRTFSFHRNWGSAALRPSLAKASAARSTVTSGAAQRAEIGIRCSRMGRIAISFWVDSKYLF